MNRTALRMTFRDNWIRVLAVFTPFAVAAQFVGTRSPLEITLWIAFILSVVGVVIHASYSRDRASLNRSTVPTGRSGAA